VTVDAHGTVTVHGLSEFRKAVMTLEGKSDFVDAMKRVGQLIVDDTQRRVPARSGALRASYRAAANGAGARVLWGGTKAIYAPWMEFGGRKHGKLKGRTTKRTQPVDRPRLARGRYLYPSIDRNQDQIQEQVIKEMNQLLARYGMGVE
jgi:hypothetical protein